MFRNALEKLKINQFSSFLLIPLFSLLFVVGAHKSAMANSATLSWTTPATNTDGTPLINLAGYKVYYGTASRVYGTPLDVGLANVNSPSYIVNNLGTGTYYFAVTSYNAAGLESAYSVEVSKTFTGPIISGISASNIAANSALISWTSSIPATSQVEYGPSTAYGSLTTFDSNLLTTHSQTLSALQANTTYHYRVKSADGAGNMSVSSDNAFTTTSSGTSTTGLVIYVVTAGSNTSTSAVISWTTNNPSTSQVEYGLTTGYGSSTGLDRTLTIVHSQTLSGLQAGTLYHFHVKSSDAAGNPAVSSDYSVTTSVTDQKAVFFGGCGMTAPHDGNSSGPGQAADMLAVMGMMLLPLIRKITRQIKVRMSDVRLGVLKHCGNFPPLVLSLKFTNLKKEFMMFQKLKTIPCRITDRYPRIGNWVKTGYMNKFKEIMQSCRFTSSVRFMKLTVLLPVALLTVILVRPEPVVAASSIAGCQIFPSNNIWSADISTLPVDPNSSAYVNSITANGSFLHADFGTVYNGAPNGIPYISVAGTQPKVAISFTYSGESDPGPYPIPPGAPIEGGPSGTGDRHVLVIDKDHCLLYEMFNSFPQPDGSWKADSGAVFNLLSNALRPAGWTSADAAGLPVLAGLVTYDEVATGQITHALRFTAVHTQKAYVWPGRHYASTLTGTQYPPMGQRFRLKASFDVSTFPPEDQVILNALKKYGMFLADNGGSWFLSGAPDSRWNDNNLSLLSRVPGSAFEAVAESSLVVNVDLGQALGIVPLIKPAPPTGLLIK